MKDKRPGMQEAQASWDLNFSLALSLFLKHLVVCLTLINMRSSFREVIKAGRRAI
jgi:uncharacterized membrane protein YagU involved in acid resistance